jgi:hypothetical protein
MNSRFSDLLGLVLKFLTEKNALTPEEAELLYELLVSSEAMRVERDDFLLSIDKSYLANEMDFQENYEARRKAGCAELSLNPRKRSKAAKGLIQEGVLIEKMDGVAPTEPSHQIPLEILLSRTAFEPIAKHLPKLTRWIGQLVSPTGIIVLLPERQKLVNEITHKLDQSPSILLSKSPSIFNPSEFEAAYSNHTLYFADTIRTVDQPLYYFWDLDAVTLQIQDDLKNANINTLIEGYQRHFAPYGQNTHLTVICGNNSAVQENWEVRPFVSREFLIKGERVEGKLKGGAMVNRRRLENFVATTPYFGKWATLVVETYFEERYERLRREIVDNPDNIILHRHDESSIREFIARIFSVATSPSKRELDS